MRALLALGGALVLAGCAGGDRVTLLEPIQQDKRAAGQSGAVAVIDPELAQLSTEEYEARSTDETDLALIDDVNEQARLGRGTPRVRQLEEADPAHAELIAGMPLEVVVGRFGFDTGSRELSPAVLGQLTAFLSDYVTRFNARYGAEPEKPELHVEITGFADADGYADLTDDAAITARNVELSRNRAITVYYQLMNELGGEIPISAQNIEVVGAGDYAALRESGGVRGPNDAYRLVTVTVR